jgi:phage shock protein A
VKDQLADKELEALRKNQKAEVTLSSLKAAVQQIKNMVFEFKSQIEHRTQHIQELDRLIESYKQQEQDLQN